MQVCYRSHLVFLAVFLGFLGWWFVTFVLIVLVGGGFSLDHEGELLEGFFDGDDPLGVAGGGVGCLRGGVVGDGFALDGSGDGSALGAVDVLGGGFVVVFEDDSVVVLADAVVADVVLVAAGDVDVGCGLVAVFAGGHWFLYSDGFVLV